MNKRASLTTKAIPTGNYPDVLGALTNGQHLNVDVVQAALATRPTAVVAGKQFEALIVLQNTSNVDVDAVIRLSVPESDKSGHKGRFSSTVTKPIRIGLRPAEVGVANLPLMCNQLTAPANDYQVHVELQIEQKQRGALRIRDHNGGVPLDLNELPEERQEVLAALQLLRFSTLVAGKPSGNKATLGAPFEVLPAQIVGLPQDLKPGYVTLWTIADYPDEAMIAEKVKDLTAVIMPQLNRANVFFPLLKTTQTRYDAAQFRLWAGEAIAVAKLLTLVLETGLLKLEKGETETVFPRWYMKLCRMLVQNPQSAANLEVLVTQGLYAELVYDAALLGFSMITTVTRETFGTPEEMAGYAKHLAASLNGHGDPLDFTHGYLPLILAGIIANSRVSMPQEQVRDTASMMATGRENRASQMNDSNKFLFDITDDLITRALEHF